MNLFPGFPGLICVEGDINVEISAGTILAILELSGEDFFRWGPLRGRRAGSVSSTCRQRRENPARGFRKHGAGVFRVTSAPTAPEMVDIYQKQERPCIHNPLLREKINKPDYGDFNLIWSLRLIDQHKTYVYLLLKRLRKPEQEDSFIFLIRPA